MQIKYALCRYYTSRHVGRHWLNYYILEFNCLPANSYYNTLIPLLCIFIYYVSINNA